MDTILYKAFSLVLVIIIGQAIKKIGWVSSADFPKFSRIVLRLTIPCAVITGFNGVSITYKLLLLTVIGIGVNLIAQVTGYLLNRHKSGKEKAFGINNIGSYNIAAFAMPYISGFIGAESMVYASLFDVGNSVGAGGIGYGWSMTTARENGRASAWLFLKNMFSSPIFITYLVLLIIRLLDWQLPAAVITFTATVGSANPFLAMLMIGIGLDLHLDHKKFKLAVKYLAIRYGLALIFTLLVILFLPMPPAAKTVLCMLFFSPIAAMISAFTSEIGGDVELSAFMTSVSVIVGIIVIPLVLFAMT